MDASGNIQETIFQQIKEQMPANMSMVDEVSALLDISPASTYRRISGEKELSFSEAVKLFQHFKLRLDSVMASFSGIVPFKYVALEEMNFTIPQYLDTLLETTKAVHKMGEVEMIYVTNDITIFQLFQVPELAAFKLFFWGKTNLGFSKFRDEQFSLDNFGEQFFDTTREIAETYSKVPTIEIIGQDAISSLLRQIEYHLDAGFFIKKEDAVFLYDKLLDFLDHFQKQSEVGFKFPFGSEPKGTPGNFTLYYNEILMIDGIALVKSENTRLSYITTNPLNYLQTTDSRFFESNYKWVQTLISKSSLISGVSEKSRNSFFLKLKGQVQQYKDRVTG